MYALEINNLEKRYKNNMLALKGISLKVKKGDFFALLGHNGAGKSTTIGIINSLVKKTSGTVKLFDLDLDKDTQAIKRVLGVVPQEINFNFFDKVIKVLINQGGYYGVPRSEAIKRAEKWLKLLELWDKRNNAVRELSGGMKRRLMIARALMHNPKVLILDEPSAGVDIELRRSMWKFLNELNQKEDLTIILTTHYLEEAEMLCKNIAIIQDGKVVVESSMHDLIAQLEEETVILDLDIDLDIKDLPTLTSYKIRKLEKNAVEVDIKKGQGLNDIFKELSEQNINVLSMKNKSNRLEELFVQMAVGKSESK